MSDGAPHGPEIFAVLSAAGEILSASDAFVALTGHERGALTEVLTPVSHAQLLEALAGGGARPRRIDLELRADPPRHLRAWLAADAGRLTLLGIAEEGASSELEAARLDLLRQMADASDAGSAEAALLRWLRRMSGAVAAELWSGAPPPEPLRLSAIDADPIVLHAITDELREERARRLGAGLARAPFTNFVLDSRLAPHVYAFRLGAPTADVIVVLRADAPWVPPPPPPPSFTAAVAHLLAARRRFDAEHEQARLHATLLETQSELDEGILLLDTERMQILYANDAVRRISGYSVEELNATRTIDSLIAAEERPLLHAVIGGPHALDDDTHRIVTRIHTKTGREADVEVFSRALTVDSRVRLAVVRDITDRFAAEEALLRSEARVRKLIETFPDVLVVSRVGLIVYANPAAVRATGLPLDELLGRPVLDFVHPEDRAVVGARLRDLGAGRPGTPTTFRTISIDGRSATVDVLSLPIEFDGVSSILTLLRDITDKREMERKLIQADRLASLGTLSAGVAHEINNPLTYVLLHIAALARELPRLVRDLEGHADAGLSREDLVAAITRVREIDRRGVEIADGVNRIEGIVRDLGSFSRSDDSHTYAVDVRRCLDAALKLSAHHLRDRAQVVREYADVPPVIASEARLGQVFLNLLLNAGQAITPGHPEENAVRIRVTPSGVGVLVEISDSGAGMPPEILSRIFDPFFTTKPVGVGTGLGLSICHGIVASLGGEITVDSLLGLGTTFRIHLPAAAQTEVAAAPPPPRRPRVLVIEPEPAVASVLQRALSDENDVVIASGEAALSCLSSSERVDAIVCDLTVEGPNAAEIHARVAALRPGLERALVFTSSGAPTPEAQTLLESVANPCLEKPFDIDDVRRVIRARVRGG